MLASPADHVARFGVLAADAVAARCAGDSLLEALAVVLEAARLLAVAAPGRGAVAVPPVRGRRRVVDFRLHQIQKLLALLARLTIFATSAIAKVGAQQARPETVTVELGAAGALAVAGFVGGGVVGRERLGNRDHWQLRTDRIVDTTSNGQATTYVNS